MNHNESICICPVRTDYHSLDCQTFRSAHSAPDTEPKENRMTIKDGPLTTRQVRIIELVSQGMRHKEIASKFGMSLAVVRQEVTTVTHKMGASTSHQAVALYARAQAFMDAATFVHDESHDPATEAIAEALDTRGRSALPK